MKRLLLILCLLAAPAFAVTPDEMLPDPGLEARARAISQGLRCLVCQNESIDESHASLAHDLRVLVRERLVAGDSDDQVVAFVVERYGEFVLLQPTFGGSNLLLWIAGPLMLGTGLLVAVIHQRRRRQIADAPPLTAEEQARLQDLLHK
jgi:cytochrome c-type biogenesis protein CcmH